MHFKASYSTRIFVSTILDYIATLIKGENVTQQQSKPRYGHFIACASRRSSRALDPR